MRERKKMINSRDRVDAIVIIADDMPHELKTLPPNSPAQGGYGNNHIIPFWPYTLWLIV
jgi:hypothetical protein